MRRPEDAPSVQLSGAIAVLRRGLRETPELRQGLVFTALMALGSALGRLLVPILLQQIVDRGILAGGGFHPALVLGLCAVSAVLIVLVYCATRAAFRRLVRASETALASLRVRAFEHIHRLSVADQSESRRGTLVARVTTDVDTIGEFLDWGGISWATSLALMLGCVVAIAIYSWQLAVLVVLTVSPLALIYRLLQRRLLAAYDLLRTRIAATLSEVSESIMGADVVRAYGVEQRSSLRVRGAVGAQYSSEARLVRYTASIFPVSDIVGALAVAATIAVGVGFHDRLHLSVGSLLAVLFLIQLFLGPLAELSEEFDASQTAIAGFRKVLAVLDLPVAVTEPAPGRQLPSGALDVVVENVSYSYRDDVPVLRGVSLRIPAGGHVAVVGETGSGKTTLAKLLCRLADPDAGRILVGGVDLRAVASGSRRTALRMVPQDGFLFDATVGDNIAFGMPGAGCHESEAALRELGLLDWARALPDGLATRVGERGERLSVGERQLVALVRAQVAQPGLLILDEATSAVDPETERAMSEAMARLALGRTTVTIAHRLSTAETADTVVVVDAGRIVETGSHAELVATGGTYARLYSSWLGNTRVGAAR